MNIKPLTLATSLLITFTPALIGGAATASSVNTWYTTLIKPEYNPPNWLFGPVWTFLFLLMSVSLYLLRTTKNTEGPAKQIALTFFYLQLILNLLWSLFFFGLQNPKLALIEIGLLDIAVIFTIIAIHKVSRTAAKLLYPYLAWISFATWLNFQIAWLNR
jgi:tryptophan-rich sensory protein